MKYDNPQDIWDGITECAIHTRGMDESCEFCEAEKDQRNKVLTRMQDTVGALMQDTGRQGAQMPPWLMSDIRLDVLLQTILTDHRDRSRYEGEVGRRLILTLKETQAALRQPTLVSPNGSPLRAVKDIPQA